MPFLGVATCSTFSLTKSDGEKHVLADSCGYHQIKIRKAQASAIWPEANAASRQNVSPVSPVQSCKGDEKKKETKELARDAVASLSACFVSVFAFVESGEIICVTAKLLSLTAFPFERVQKSGWKQKSFWRCVCVIFFLSFRAFEHLSEVNHHCVFIP